MALYRANTGWDNLSANSSSPFHPAVNAAAVHSGDWIADTTADLPLTGNWPGRRIWVDAEHCDYVWDVAMWLKDTIARIWTTTINLAANIAAQGQTTSQVVFPAGLFSALPAVSITPGSARFTTAYSGLTTAGFVAVLYNATAVAGAPGQTHITAIQV